MLKEKIKGDTTPAAEKQCKWQNVYFFNNGKTVVGKNLYDTRELAAAGIEDSLREAEAKAKTDPSGDCWIGQVNSGALLSQYSWGMQIPILE